MSTCIQYNYIILYYSSQITSLLSPSDKKDLRDCRSPCGTYVIIIIITITITIIIISIIIIIVIIVSSSSSYYCHDYYYAKVHE